MESGFCTIYPFSMHQGNNKISSLVIRGLICKASQEPRNRFPAWRAGTTTLLDVRARQATWTMAESIPGLLKRLQIRAQFTR
jgi:hypothetical protein